MEELYSLISEKTGLSREMSEKVVDLVLSYIKEKLPDPIADQLENLLEGGSAADLLGGLFG